MNDGGYYANTVPIATYFRNTVIARNTVINGGSVPITVSSCPSCLIEDNLVIQDWVYGPGYYLTGIIASDEVAVSGGVDDPNTAITIRNNTIWFGPSSNGGAHAIRVGSEGTGHIIANNTITYAASNAGQGVDCFNIGTATSNIAFMNNNHCNALPFPTLGKRCTEQLDLTGKLTQAD